MTLRSPIVAMLWELWRLTRVEIAWKIVLPLGVALAALGLGGALAPSDTPASFPVTDAIAAFALIAIVLPQLVPWLSIGKLYGGQPGFPFSLAYTRPVRTSVIVGVPMAYVTVVQTAMYLVSAIVLRVTSGYAFPLLPVAAWLAALSWVGTAAFWSIRNKVIPVVVVTFAFMKALVMASDRLTAVEIPDSFDWPPRLWPTLFDWPLTDYAWIALIGLASFGVTVAMVTRQRRGDQLVAITWRPGGGGLWDHLVSLFRVPCPTSSATLAQVWMDLKSNGFPVLTIGVSLAIVILLVSSVSGRIDAAINADPRVPCPIAECFYLRAWPPLMTPLSLSTVLLLAGNAFGIRRKQGRTYVSTFEATQAHRTAQVAALKLLVKSVCVLAALIALGVSVWISMPLLGDGVFIRMWGVPLESRLSVVNDAIAALTVFEQISLVAVAVVSVVIWVAAFAVLGALRARYSRRTNIVGLLLLLYGLVLGLLALAGQRGIGPEIPLGAILRATFWVAMSAIVAVTGYLLWRGLAEQLLTVRHATGAVLLSAIFGVAWLGMLGAAGVSVAVLPVMDAARVLWPALLPLTLSVLAPWSYSRIRHT